MNRKNITTVLCTWLTISALPGCKDVESAPTCPFTTEVTYSSPTLGGFNGVDILLVVDNGPSMAEEQQILATAVFPLINALVNPLPTSQEASTDDLRIAIVSSDMGLQWGGSAYEAADGFPPTALSAACAAPMGDNGFFINDYDGADTKQIQIAQGVISCAQNGKQCPPGWLCENMDTSTGVGVCNAPEGADATVNCPPSPEEKSSTYLTVRTGVDADGPYLYAPEELATATACLSGIGTAGCEFQQPLVAAAAGLENPAQQAAFMRERSVLAVIVISDKDDCSILDGPGLFATEEIQADNGKRLATACGNNPEFLYTGDALKERFRAAKEAVSSAASAGAGVIFAAITGVPPVAECQGKGSEIADCLEHEKMQLVEMPDPADTDATIFSPACRREVDGTTITDATPGRRFVEMGQSYDSLSYIYSICNADWSPAMIEIARIIAANFGGGCFRKPLGWNPATQTSNCEVVVKFDGLDACPREWEWESDGFQVGSPDAPTISCTLPKIPSPRECPAPGTPEFQVAWQAKEDDFGWSYCENSGENFSDACKDELDNDADGKIDCDDDDCRFCKNCALNDQGDTQLCPNKCRYAPILSHSALRAAKIGQVEFQCLKPSNPDDPNCLENTAATCSDLKDNNNNGTFDCDNVSLTEATDENPARNADPECCPIAASPEGSTCNVSQDDVTSICGAGSDWPDACTEAARLLNCRLPDWQ